MTETPAPLPCPWCGNDPNLSYRGVERRRVECGCGADGPYGDTARHAIAAWNRIARPAAAVTPEAVEVARHAFYEWMKRREEQGDDRTPYAYREAMRAALLAALPHLTPPHGDAKD